MKRVLLVLLLVALALVPATAAERASKTDLAVGLNLGPIQVLVFSIG
jgi:hypothetical protein